MCVCESPVDHLCVCVQLLQIFGTLLERPRVHQLFALNYNQLLVMFEEEIHICQHILDVQREKVIMGLFLQYILKNVSVVNMVSQG